MLAEFFCARIRIVVGTRPIDGSIFLDNLVRALAGDRDRAHMAETPQAMRVAGPDAQLHYLQSSSQVDIETALLRFAIQGSGAMNDGIRGADEVAVFVLI